MPKLLLAAFLLLCSPLLQAQSFFAPGSLDPTRNLPGTSQTHEPLPEQYLWTANDITALRPDRSRFSWSRQDLRIDPHFFRASFNIGFIPKSATLYIAGPRSASVWINGRSAGVFTSDIDAAVGFHVFHADVSALLHSGTNIIAIEAVRGRGIVAGAGPNSTQQIAYGEVLAAKIVPAVFGVDAPALLISTRAWKSTATLAPDWQSPNFNDSSWPAAATLGPIEGDPDLMQWSADAGMYEWPGFLGISSGLRTSTKAPPTLAHSSSKSPSRSPASPQPPTPNPPPCSSTSAARSPAAYS
jgi:hypothetical protein